MKTLSSRTKCSIVSWGHISIQFDTVAYFGRPLRRLTKKFKGSRVSLADAPFKLRDDMSEKAVAIHKGGLGFAVAADLAGVPQILLYSHEEHWFTANAIVRAGAGAAAKYNDITDETLTEATERVTGSPVMRERALRLEQIPAKLHDFADKDLLQHIDLARFLFGKVIPPCREAR